jgi:hypothetical protein
MQLPLPHYDFPWTVKEALSSQVLITDSFISTGFENLTALKTKVVSRWGAPVMGENFHFHLPRTLVFVAFDSKPSTKR